MRAQQIEYSDFKNNINRCEKRSQGLDLLLRIRFYNRR